MKSLYQSIDAVILKKMFDSYNIFIFLFYRLWVFKSSVFMKL